MAHIFISYSHTDTEYAHALAESLQSMGFEVWIDERLDYGSQWPQELQKQLDSCSAFIVIMSPRSYSSEWVQSELQRAKRKLKPIFPLLLEGDEPWLSVESTQYYDVRGAIYPDAKFYSALKNVLSSTPGARTLQFPKGRVKAKQGRTPSSLRLGLIIAAVGILLIVLAGSAMLAMRPFLAPRTSPSAPIVVLPTTETVSEKSTSVPETTFTPQETVTEPAQIANTGSGEDQMVPVPAGEFTMGGKAIDELADCKKFTTNCNVTWFTDEEPAHRVSVEAFYIDKYEVTNALYKACQEQGACTSPQALNSSTQPDYYGNPDFDSYPVIYVNWNQAKAYCEWRGDRLPTEAEWEKAARGTDGRKYPWGGKLDESLANFHWHVADTTAVGSYEGGKSPYGAYDMAGNVWEWVSSLAEPYPYNKDDGRESPTASGKRVIRGGSWGNTEDNSVSSLYRDAVDPGKADLDIGFRCAKDANP